MALNPSNSTRYRVEMHFTVTPYEGEFTRTLTVFATSEEMAVSSANRLLYNKYALGAVDIHASSVVK